MAKILGDFFIPINMENMKNMENPNRLPKYLANAKTVLANNYEQYHTLQPRMRRTYQQKSI